MSEVPRFLPFPGERAGQDPEQYLNNLVERLQRLRALFLYEADLSEFTPVNLRSHDRELRDICRSLDQNLIFMRTTQSKDKIILALHSAKKSINLAIDLFEMKKTFVNRKRLYDEYTHVAAYLYEAIEELRREEE